MTFDDREFLVGLHEAFNEFEHVLAPEHNFETGQRIIDRAKQIAEAHRLTGETIDSLEAIRDGEETAIGSNIASSKPVDEEFGTFDQAPRPFFRPAILEEEA
jgi:hypothetical protein